jgi:hypothetical protein
MTEPAVTLTDYALAIECAVFVFALVRLDARDRTLRYWFVVFFASIGAASVGIGNDYTSFGGRG